MSASGAPMLGCLWGGRDWALNDETLFVFDCALAAASIADGPSTAGEVMAISPAAASSRESLPAAPFSTRMPAPSLCESELG